MTDHILQPPDVPSDVPSDVPGGLSGQAASSSPRPVLTAGSPPPGRRGAKRAKVAKPARRPSPFRFVSRAIGAVAGLGVAAAIVGGAFALHTYDKYAADLPSLDGLAHYQPKVMSRVYSGDSRLIAELATERRIFVPVSSIPDLVKQAFVSAEDQKFWTHKGVDPVAMARAGFYDLALRGQGKRPIGASTITQQVAKNMLLSNEVSIARKVKEMILAVRIDQSLSKEHVLELYLNEIFLGLQSYGVAAAAQAYFNKGLDDLTLPEAAFLAALPKAPNNYNPFRYPDAAKARRDWVLDRMADDRAVTPEQAAAAKATPIQTAAFRRPEFVTGSEWFAEEVRRQVTDQFGADAATAGGLTIRTSMDPALQAAADTALRKGLTAYDRSHGGWRGPVGHIEGGPNMRLGWTGRLAALPRPPGLLPDWNLSVVLEASGDEAKVGWVERGSGGEARTGSLYASDIGWARPAHANGGFGPSPRRVTDILQVGDVIMTEPAGVGAAAPARGPARPDRLWLRQVPQVQGALVTIDPMTGRVLAMSGGWSGDASQFNRATQAQRQPGSSFKPIVYLTALEAGMSPSQRILDAPFVQKLGNGEVWEPNNYGMTFNGPTPMRIALERSLNLVSVRLAEKVGMEAVRDNAVAFHVVDNMPLVLPAALGAVETTVLRQAVAYAILARGGRDLLPSMVDSIQDRDGKTLWVPPNGMACTGCGDPARPPIVTDARPQVADEQSVFQLVTMMQGVVTKGSGYAAGAGLGRAIAGKTGTTQDANDAWFVGFTPDLVTAVWIGFDNNTSLGERETGGGIAAPIWHDYMAVALKNRPNLQFRMPEGLKMVAWGSGRTDAFKPDQVPGGSSGTIGGGEGGGGGGGRGGEGGAVAVSSGVGVDSGMGGLY